MFPSNKNMLKIIETMSENKLRYSGIFLINRICNNLVYETLNNYLKNIIVY